MAWVIYMIGGIMKKNSHPIMDGLPEEVQQYILHLERMRSDFVANVSHELRTPLTVMRGYLETLLQQDNEATKPYRKIFQQMYQHSLRMATIIQDLLLLSRLESDDIPQEEKTIVDVPQLLKMILIDAKNISGNKNHHFKLETNKKLLMRGNESELRSLFQNIIINAVKYTPAKGHITIKWYESSNEEVVFSVADTGIGIESKHIPRITERFYRVDKARSRDSGGTGLGLAIVKHVLLRHDGELTIESTEGKGSIFSCIFPASVAFKKK